jgi:hypothetical protein
MKMKTVVRLVKLFISEFSAVSYLNPRSVVISPFKVGLGREGG